jgi:hypothetical protein
MSSSLPINRLVNVSVNLAPQAAQMQNISNLLILGSSDIIDVVARLRNYTNINDVAADFGTSAPEYLAALLWFEQSPQPTTLSVGRWAQTATHGNLIGATLSAAQQVMSLWTPMTTPGFLIRLDGIPYAMAPASFAAQTNMNGIAALIQTALAAAVASSTCVWNSIYSRFDIKSGTTGVASSVSFAAPSTAVGSAAFSGNPANLDTLTINGTVITFVTGTPVGSQVAIGGTLTITLASLLAFLQASADVQLVKFTYSINPANTALYLVSVAVGTAGNAYTLAKSSTAITLSGATMAGGTAQDISSMLGMTSTSSGAYLAAGIAAESAAAAVGIFDNQFGQSWYGMSICGAVNADHLAVAAAVEAMTNKHVYGVTTQESGVLVSTDTTNIAYSLKQLAYKRTVVQYSSSNAYAVNSLLGRILTVDYNGNNTTITLMYKQEPGIVAETLSSTQLTALEDFNCNVFVAYNNNTAIIEKGVVASGEFLDVITGTDWLALDIQTSVYNLLFTSPTKIPQSDAGNHTLVTVIESVCSQALQNGLVAPGVWTSGGFGGLAQGDFMPTGYYIYAPPISSQSDADRAARKSVTIQVAIKLAGAIHTVNVVVNVNR